MPTSLRVALSGIAAGLLALLTWVLVVYLALAVFTLLFTLVDELARARAAGAALEAQLWTQLGQSLLASGRNALTGLWDLRGAFAVFGALGLFAAVSYQVGRLWARPGWVSFLSLAALAIIAAIVWIYVQREQIGLWMAESPEVYRWRDVLLNTQYAALTAGAILALTLTYPAWAAWQWWYTRLAPAPAAPPPPNPSRADAGARGYAARLAALKTGAADPAEAVALPAPPPAWLALARNHRLLALLTLLAVLGFAGFGVAERRHAQVSLRLQHGATFADATTQPHVEFPLQIAADVHRLRIVNINGLGTVTLTLRPAADPTQIVGAVRDWAFEWRADDYLYQEIPVHGLAPGDYLLVFEQTAGWGYFEYMLSQGGGSASQTLALAAGLLLAVGVLFTVAALALVAAWFAARDRP